MCVCVWRAHACMYYAASRRRRGDHSACGATNRHRRLGLAILLLLALPLSLMLLLLRGLPPSYHLRGFRSLTTHPEPIALGFGYSTGEHCHADPPLLPPESRPSGCTAPAYAHQLMRAANGLTASVIIIAHNEAGCALRRTLLAVMSPSRATALAEVIVVDDSSSPSASEALAAAGGIQGTVRVRYLRSEERLGVVRARTLAARRATAPVLAFLDAHCEPQVGWLPPLLALLAQSPKAVALPVIERIDPRTWRYVPQANPSNPQVGVIADWNLTFGWRRLTAEEAERREESGDPLAPLRSPAMAGGVFAMTKEWFFGSGGYDEHLEVWGVENIEMALRVWRCGGELLTLPCSRVGHVFRSRQPFTWPNATGAITVRRNAWRVATVWMEELAPAIALGRDAKVGRGFVHELEGRMALGARLECKSFRWYIENVFPDHPPFPDGFAWADDEA